MTNKSSLLLCPPGSTPPHVSKRKSGVVLSANPKPLSKNAEPYGDTLFRRIDGIPVAAKPPHQERSAGSLLYSKYDPAKFIGVPFRKPLKKTAVRNTHDHCLSSTVRPTEAHFFRSRTRSRTASRQK